MCFCHLLVIDIKNEPVPTIVDMVSEEPGEEEMVLKQNALKETSKSEMVIKPTASGYITPTASGYITPTQLLKNEDVTNICSSSDL